jgi:hypothetical protein
MELQFEFFDPETQLKFKSFAKKIIRMPQSLQKG